MSRTPSIRPSAPPPPEPEPQGRKHEEERVAPPAQSRAGSGCRSTSGAAHASGAAAPRAARLVLGQCPTRRRQLPRPAARAAGARSRVAPRLAAAASRAGCSRRRSMSACTIALVVVPSALCYYALDAQRAWAKLLCVPSVSDDILEPAAAASVAATTGAVAFNTFGRGLSRVGPGDCSWWADLCRCRRSSTSSAARRRCPSSPSSCAIPSSSPSRRSSASC